MAEDFENRLRQHLFSRTTKRVEGLTLDVAQNLVHKTGPLVLDLHLLDLKTLLIPGDGRVERKGDDHDSNLRITSEKKKRTIRLRADSRSSKKLERKRTPQKAGQPRRL